MAVKGYAKESTPTVEMAKEFTVFLFTTRQRRSLVEREGLGDSAARDYLYQIRFCALARGVDANVVDNGVSSTHSRRDSNGTPDASRDSQTL